MTNNKIFSLGLFGMTSFFEVESFPKEGETVRSVHSFYEAGGKGYNQAYTAKKLGANVDFYAPIGNDYYTEDLVEALKNNNFNFLKYEDAPNDFASVVLDKNGENFVLLNKGASLKVTEENVNDLKENIKRAKAILIQNEIPFPVVKKILEISFNEGLITVFDTAPITEELLNNEEIIKYCSVVTPNWAEAVELSSSNLEDTPQKVAKRLKEMGARNVVITMGSKGTFVLTEENKSFFEAIIPVETKDTTGAGDVFSASLTVSLCNEKSMNEAVKFASAVSALSVKNKGVITAIPDKNEVYKLINEIYHPQ